MAKFFIVGIDYDGKLKGVSSDIRTYQYQSVLLDAECELYRTISRGEMLSQLERLRATTHARDTLYLAFIGFGTQVKIESGIKHKGYQNAFVLYDGERYEVIYECEIMSFVNSMRCKVNIFFDCAFSNKKKRQTPEGLVERILDCSKVETTDDIVECTKPKQFNQRTILYASIPGYPAYENENGGIFSTSLRKIYTKIFIFSKIYSNIVIDTRSVQFPKYYSSSNIINKIKIFNQDEITRKKSNRRRTKKIKRERKQYEPSEACIWQP